MPDPGFTRPDLCSIRAAARQAEPAEAARDGLTADRHPPADDDPPAPLASGIELNRTTQFRPGKIDRPVHHHHAQSYPAGFDGRVGVD